MESVFCDSERVIHVDFLPNGVTVNAQYYNSMLCNNVHQALWRKISGEVPKEIIRLQDNACPHTENLSQATLAAMGWEIMNYPPYSAKPQRFLFVWINESAPMGIEISD